MALAHFSERLRAMMRSVPLLLCRRDGTRALLGSLRILQGRRTSSCIKAGFTAWIDAIASVLTEAGLTRRTARVRAQNAVFAIEGALRLPWYWRYQAVAECSASCQSK